MFMHFADSWCRMWLARLPAVWRGVFSKRDEPGVLLAQVWWQLSVEKVSWYPTEKSRLRHSALTPQIHASAKPSRAAFQGNPPNTASCASVPAGIRRGCMHP
jgi:hypothetical protein